MMQSLFKDNPEDTRGALFDNNRQYRYLLWRIWDAQKPSVMFIGLNPSTANEDENDATIRRVISMARAWGYGAVYMANCFPYISTDPKHLQFYREQIGRELGENDKWLQHAGSICKTVVFAWGNFKIVTETGRHIELQLLFPHAMALVINGNGSPRHPLYVPTNTELIKYHNRERL